MGRRCRLTRAPDEDGLLVGDGADLVRPVEGDGLELVSREEVDGKPDVQLLAYGPSKKCAASFIRAGTFKREGTWYGHCIILPRNDTNHHRRLFFATFLFHLIIQ